MRERDKLKIYDVLREFHKNEFNDTWNKYSDQFSDWEQTAFETLNGILYMCEDVFVKSKESKGA